ncbi:MAG TPA: hypothetical protein DCS43_02695 [Verrucomicrobia bacterium]|nr:hypothetical protein [Verrucomicrobiota bacterium]
MRIRNVFFVGTFTALLSGLSAQAIDRGAESIESLRVGGFSYDYYDGMELVLASEVAVPNTYGKWAVIAELGAGELSAADDESFDQLNLTLGVKHYLSDLTSLSLLGAYAWYDGVDEFNIGSVLFSARQSLVYPEEPLVPYIRVTAGLQFIDPSWGSPARQSDSYDQFIAEILAGCEFRMNRELAFVFEAGLSESEALDNGGPDLSDGWLARLSMQYDGF